MVGDFFNEYLRDDFDALDTELNGAQWFQKQQEHAEQQMLQQNRPEMEKPDDQNNQVDNKPPTESPFRNTFDRKKQNESRQDRLQRIKEEYNVPYISFSSLQERRKQRKQQIEKMKQELQGKDMGETVKDGLAANTPGFTQLIEQTDPTNIPMSSMGEVKGFTKTSRDTRRDKTLRVYRQNDDTEIIRYIIVIGQLEARDGFEVLRDQKRSNEKWQMYATLQDFETDEFLQKKCTEVSTAEIESITGYSLEYILKVRDRIKRHETEERTLDQDRLFLEKPPRTYTHAGITLTWISTTGGSLHEYEAKIGTKYATFEIFPKDQTNKDSGWIVLFQGEDIGGGDTLEVALYGTCDWLRNEEALKEEHETTEDTPSIDNLKEWFKEGKNKRCCKKAISFENDPEAAEWFEQERQRVEPKDIEELAKEMDIESEELKEWLKSAGGKRFCKRAIKR